MWMDRYGAVWMDHKDANMFPQEDGSGEHPPIPVAVLDLRAEAVEGYVEKVAAVIRSVIDTGEKDGMGDPRAKHLEPLSVHAARAALTALLGPLPKRGKAKGDR